MHVQNAVLAVNFPGPPSCLFCELLNASVKHAHLGGSLPNILRLLSSLTADDALPSHFPKSACLLAKNGAESCAHTWMAMSFCACVELAVNFIPFEARNQI